MPPCGLPGHNRFNHIEHPALLVTGQAGNLIEDLLGAALRATPALWCGFPPDEKIQGGAESLGHGRELFGLQANAFAFPVGDELLGDAKAFGHLLLGEARLLAGFSQSAAEVCGWFGAWSSSGHGGSIPIRFRITRKCLH